MSNFQADYANVQIDEKVPCVVVEWKAYASSIQFHSTLEKAFEIFLEYGKENKKLHWIFDCKKMKVVSSEDIKWANEEFNPRLLKKGLRYMAFILPESIFATTAIEEYQRNTDPNHFTLKNFNEINEAKKWLKSISRKNDPVRKK